MARLLNPMAPAILDSEEARFMTLQMIISGGQTGADRGALDAALEVGFPCGGWCPEGRKAEDWPIDGRYPLQVLRGAGYRKRTIRNIQDSDGTVIFCPGEPVGGSALTFTQCQRWGKPCLVIDTSEYAPAGAAEILADALERHRLGVLNVAGSSESRSPGIGAYVRATIGLLLER